jgi:cytochrome c oxidase subunit 3
MSADPSARVQPQSGGAAPAHSATTGAHHPNRLAVNRLGLWLFIFSETFLFAAIISSRYFLLGLSRPEELNQILGLLITIILIGSSLTAYRAEVFAAHGNLQGLRRNLLATLGLGVLFVAGVVWEWKEAFEHFPPHEGFGTLFFTTTGIHAFHVVTGMIALAIVYGLARDGRFTRGHYWGVEGSVKYWHFVDVAWVFIYPTLYLVN